MRPKLLSGLFWLGGSCLVAAALFSIAMAVSLSQLWYVASHAAVPARVISFENSRDPSSRRRIIGVWLTFPADAEPTGPCLMTLDVQAHQSPPFHVGDVVSVVPREDHCATSPLYPPSIDDPRPAAIAGALLAATGAALIGLWRWMGGRIPLETRPRRMMIV